MSEATTQQFPNLAGQQDCDEAITAELEAAGIATLRMPLALPGEVPTRIAGWLGPWHFKRAWRYWVAKGPGLPPEYADRLHASHGQSCRVDGHSMAPAPSEWFGRFAVGRYHVDGPEGLKALADTIREVIALAPVWNEEGDVK